MAHFIGSKGQAGLFEKIINLIPPHLVYIEAFGGLATIARRKKPAAESYVIDRQRNPKLVLPPHVQFVRGCGIEFLKTREWSGREFVYCDPPYLLSTIKYARYYPDDLPPEKHEELLHVCLGIPAKVMISGYPHPLYDELLKGWNCERVKVFTRHHQERTECLWTNYPRPVYLHEYTYAGDNWRKRQDLKRKVRSWCGKFQKMEPIERAAIFAALADLSDVGPGSQGESAAGRRRAAADSPSPAAHGGSAATGGEAIPGMTEVAFTVGEDLRGENAVARSGKLTFTQTRCGTGVTVFRGTERWLDLSGPKAHVAKAVEALEQGELPDEAFQQRHMTEVFLYPASSRHGESAATAGSGHKVPRELPGVRAT